MDTNGLILIDDIDHPYGYTNHTIAFCSHGGVPARLYKWNVLVEKLEAQMFSRLIISHHELLPRSKKQHPIVQNRMTCHVLDAQLVKCEVPCKCRTM